MPAIPQTMPPATQEFSDTCHGCKRYARQFVANVTFRNGRSFTTRRTTECQDCGHTESLTHATT